MSGLIEQLERALEIQRLRIELHALAEEAAESARVLCMAKWECRTMAGQTFDEAMVQLVRDVFGPPAVGE